MKWITGTFVAGALLAAAADRLHVSPVAQKAMAGDFSWRDASIGGTAVLGAVLMLAGIAMLVRRRRARVTLVAGGALIIAGILASSASAALDPFLSPSAYNAAVRTEKFLLDFSGSTGAATPGGSFSTKVVFGSPEATPADRGLVVWNSDAITDAGSTAAANGVGPIEGKFTNTECAFAFDYSSGKLGTVELYGVDDGLIATLPGGAGTFFGVVSPTVPIKRFVISGNLFESTARDRIFIDNFRVNECVSNTPPTVVLAGVEDGASYEFGTPLPIGCFVTDAEDGPTRFGATLSEFSGPLAARGLGSRTASCSYTDSGGLTATAQATYTIVDTTPPELRLDGIPAVDIATGPAGAELRQYAPLYAWDFVDGNIGVVTCNPPLGTVIPIGTTQVTCSATDASGNTAWGTRVVHVLGAAEQLEILRRWIEVNAQDRGVRESLLGKLQNGSCGALGAFINEVRARTGRGIDQFAAGASILSATNIRNVLACR